MSFESISRLFMSAFYLIAGCVLLFTDLFADRITDYRNEIGGVLIGYGILRFFLWQRWNKSQQEDNQ